MIGRPFGVCSILYRKSLLSSISSVVTNSNRFCAVKIVDGGARSYLMVCVYMPSLIDSSSHLDYLNTIGELQGFIDIQEFDMLLVVGDFMLMLIDRVHLNHFCLTLWMITILLHLTCRIKVR